MVVLVVCSVVECFSVTALSRSGCLAVGEVVVAVSATACPSPVPSVCTGPVAFGADWAASAGARANLTGAMAFGDATVGFDTIELDSAEGSSAGGSSGGGSSAGGRQAADRSAVVEGADRSAVVEGADRSAVVVVEAD